MVNKPVRKEKGMNRAFPKVLGLAAAFFFAGFLIVAAGNTVIEFWSWNNEGSYPLVHEDAQRRRERHHGAAFA